MLEKVEYLNSGIKKQNNQFWCSCNHFQSIIQVCQSFNIPGYKEYHQFLVKSTFRLPLLMAGVCLKLEIGRRAQS